MRTISSVKDNAETALQLRAAYAADVANCLASLQDEASSAGASSMLNSTFSLPVDCRRVPSPSHASRFRRLSRIAECRLSVCWHVVTRFMLLVAWHCLRTFRMRATMSAVSSWRSSATPTIRGSSRVWRCTHVPCGMPLLRIACRVSVLCLAPLSHRPSFSVSLRLLWADPRDAGALNWAVTCGKLPPTHRLTVRPCHRMLACALVRARVCVRVRAVHAWSLTGACCDCVL
jgi:hypothetical protein